MRDPPNDYSITFLGSEGFPQMITALHFGRGGSLKIIAVDFIGGEGGSEKNQNWLHNNWTAPYPPAILVLPIYYLNKILLKKIIFGDSLTFSFKICTKTVQINTTKTRQILKWP